MIYILVNEKYVCLVLMMKAKNRRYSVGPLEFLISQILMEYSLDCNSSSLGVSGVGCLPTGLVVIGAILAVAYKPDRKDKLSRDRSLHRIIGRYISYLISDVCIIFTFYIT